MKKEITIEDKQFELFIEQEVIEQEIKRVARRINSDMKGKKPLFISVLNGAFMFAGELMKHVTLLSEITFARYSSYKGTSSVNVEKVMELNEDIKGRHVVIVEDIVDSGNTMDTLIAELEKHEPAEVKIATLLFKPAALKKNLKPDYVAIEIPNDFVVGYGLDYNGFGRNLKDIYKVK